MALIYGKCIGKYVIHGTYGTQFSGDESVEWDAYKFLKRALLSNDYCGSLGHTTVHFFRHVTRAMEISSKKVVLKRQEKPPSFRGKLPILHLESPLGLGFP